MGAALLLPLLLLAQNKPPEKCTISGTVVDSVTGEPLDKVDIVAEPVGRGGGNPAVARSDRNGHFVVSDLDPGSYRLKGRRNRFLDTYYGARRAESNGIPLVLESGQTVRDLRFKVLPFGVIAGTVRDPEGEPIARATVTAIRVKYENGHRRVKVVDAAFTDEAGQYRITGLAPGRYYVRVDPKPKGSGALEGVMMFGTDIGTITTDVNIVELPVGRQTQMLLPALYPGVQASDAAHTVDVEAGARVTGIDIAVPRSGTVTVKGHVSVPEKSQAGMIALNRSQWIGNSLDTRLITNPDEHGDFEFPGVPEGSYTLTANAMIQSPPPSGGVAIDGGTVFMGGSRAYIAELPLEVGTTPIEGIKVVVNAGAEVTGRAVLAGERGPIPMGNIQFDDGSSQTRATEIRDGNFSLDLPAGRYHVYLGTGGAPPDAVPLLRSATWAGRDILSEGLTITGPSKVTLDLVAAPDGGKLDGTALDADDKPVGGAKIILIPEPKYRFRNDRYFEADTDQNGHFEIDGVAPGEYKAYAWEDIEPGIWRDPDFVKTIEAKGEPLTIKTGGHESLKLHAR
jgi:hypothetical protein